jgi:hypothetical protein
MARNATPKKQAGPTQSVTVSLDRVLALKRLLATAKGACWGAVGGTFAIVLNEIVRNHAPSFAVNSSLAATIGTALSAAAYGITSRTSWIVRRCLLKSHAMYIDGLVNKTQFGNMQKRCLERWL